MRVENASSTQPPFGESSVFELIALAWGSNRILHEVAGVQLLRIELNRFDDLAKWLTQAAIIYHVEFKKAQFALSEYATECQGRVDEMKLAPFSTELDITATIKYLQICRKLLCVALGDVFLYVTLSVPVLDICLTSLIAVTKFSIPKTSTKNFFP